MLTQTQRAVDSQSARLHNPPWVKVYGQPTRSYFVSVFGTAWPSRSSAASRATVTVTHAAVPVSTICAAV